jgi:chorismate dehydratase
MPGPLRLGHITYSNCFPVHARLLDRPADGDPILVEGVPSYLNRLLLETGIDVAPSSSIEYAYHSTRYRLFPDLVIGSRGPVGSIVFISDRPPEELGEALIALPTASATSVVLLKILLVTRWGVKPRFIWFDQSNEDPFAAGAAAALFIGDVALRPSLFPTKPVRLDLGSEWWDHTDLPFAFALWQTSAPKRSGDLLHLHSLLVESRSYGLEERATLAERYAPRFGMEPPALDRYWADLSFELDDAMIEGLHQFYRLAEEIGELSRAPDLRWILG